MISLKDNKVREEWERSYAQEIKKRKESFEREENARKSERAFSKLGEI